jgi:hypothetical protein
MNGNIGIINESIAVVLCSSIPDVCVSGKREDTQARERTRPSRKADSSDGGVF